ncbi:MAG: DUF4118 domain-containing protein [bacterium]|nr:DUF4118 domain-containing protein [bacterium]
MDKTLLRIYGVMVLAIMVVTVLAVSLRAALTLANFTMIYLLLVFFIAIQNGTVPAFAAAVISIMCINFFLIRPYYSLAIADPRELLDLAVFFIVAGVAGRLGAYSRLQAHNARRRAQEQEILYHLTRTFNQITSREAVLDALVKTLSHDLNAQHTDILPNANPLAEYESTVHYLPLQSGESIYGTVRATFYAPPPLHLLSSCVSLAANALQRIELVELAVKSRELEEADNLKTALLHAVSHDLRTPITIIKSSASNLRSLYHQLSGDEQIAIAETIETEVDELNKLVGNLLDMSRLNAGALTLNSQPNSLEEIAGDVAARVWQLTRQERIKISFPGNMPSVPFDYGLMLQAVTNIVENSLRYEPPHLQIEIRGDVQNKMARLMIVNHGATIPPDVKAHMMQPFYHGREGRIGLGLPIAKGIIEAHHGCLSVEDTPGGGATFVVMLSRDGGDEAKNPDCG